ncbi:MAG TPA: TIGR03084 family metal-binding protein [Acidimicrobiales bacterium]|nr:TIGR03084 family metal-binding protein [Acidimicrobiales bacterium]
MSGPDLDQLAAHLVDETDALVDVLEALPADRWATPTPSEGWSIADQVSHLAYFDGAATMSVLDRAAFGDLQHEAAVKGTALCDEVAARYRDLTADELMGWWRAGRASMLAAMLAGSPSRRVPWYGPDFSVASSLTGRIMETWAHGQDVYDALGVPHRETAALYDVTRLCARTRANSYAARGMTMPPGDVVVELVAPSGATWTFGEDAAERIAGSAVEFCLVATQRRHFVDTGLVATGPAASQWLEIAQAFAGPPGPGRAPLDATT